MGLQLIIMSTRLSISPTSSKQVPVDYFKVQCPNANVTLTSASGPKMAGWIKYSHGTKHIIPLGLRRQDWDSLNMNDAFALTNHNWYNNLSWREYLNNGWKMDLGASYSTNLDNIGQQVQNAFNQPQNSDSDSTFWMNYKNFGVNQRLRTFPR